MPHFESIIILILTSQLQLQTVLISYQALFSFILSMKALRGCLNLLISIGSWFAFSCAIQLNSLCHTGTDQHSWR